MVTPSALTTINHIHTMFITLCVHDKYRNMLENPQQLVLKTTKYSVKNPDTALLLTATRPRLIRSGRRPSRESPR